MAFILNLVANKELNTKDSLAQGIGVVDNQVCALCNVANETIEHLFFEFELSF